MANFFSVQNMWWTTVNLLVWCTFLGCQLDTYLHRMTALYLLVICITINMKLSHPCIETEAKAVTGLTPSQDDSTSTIGNQFYSYGFHQSLNIDTLVSFLLTRTVTVNKPRGTWDKSDTTVSSNVPTVQAISHVAKDQVKIKKATGRQAPASIMNNQEHLPEQATPIHAKAIGKSNGMHVVHSRSVMAITRELPLPITFELI